MQYHCIVKFNLLVYAVFTNLKIFYIFTIFKK